MEREPLDPGAPGGSASTPRHRGTVAAARLAPLLVFAAALAARLFHLAQLRGAPFAGFKLGDAEVYDAWARRIAGGDWLGEGVFYQAPLYPYFLGALYATLGDAVETVRLVQAVLGALACALLAAAGARLFPAHRAAGPVAGLLLAFSLPALFYDALLQKSVLDGLFVCLSLYLLARLIDAPGPRGALALGCATGGFALTRENALALAPALLLFLLWPRRAASGALLEPARRRGAGAAAFVAGLVLVLAPVALRNGLVGGEFHPTTSQLGPNLFIGNNPLANGTYQPLRVGGAHARYEREDATRLAEEAAGHALTPGEVSDYYVGLVLDYARAQPGHFLRGLLRKLGLTWSRIEVSDSEDPWTHAEWSLLLRASGLLLHFGVLAPLAVLGFWTTWGERRRLWPLHLLVLVFTASVALFYVFGRYRYPLVPFLTLFAAAGLCGGRAAWRRASPAARARAVTAVLASAVLTNLPLFSVALMRSTTHVNVGNALLRTGRVDAAEREYARALELRSDNALAHNNLGLALLARGRAREALRHFEEALRHQPRFTEARENLERARRALERGQAGTDG